MNAPDAEFSPGQRSGGEAQRIELVTELSKVREDITRRGRKFLHTLYVLDEPAVGLHTADVEKLIHVLHRLIEAGHGSVAIEHHLLAEADWTLDFTPFMLVRLVGGRSRGRRSRWPSRSSLHTPPQLFSAVVRL